MANTLQEQMKSGTKVVTGEMIKRLNALYTQIIGICKIASDFYKNDPVKKEMFTFSKIVKHLGVSGKSSDEVIDESSTPDTQTK